MDKAKLNTELDKFRALCEERGNPLADWCIEEAYPGVSGTSYFLHVKAGDWVDHLCCSDALDILIPIFFEAVDREFRSYIIGINVTDQTERFKCFDNTFTQTGAKKAES